MGECSVDEIRPENIIYYGEASGDESDGEQVEDKEEDEQDADIDSLNENEYNESKLCTSGRRRSFIRGRNNFKWPVKAPGSRERRSSVNMYLPCANGEMKNVSTPLESWILLFSDNILQRILLHT